jgi:hypothetical protein
MKIVLPDEAKYNYNFNKTLKINFYDESLKDISSNEK